MITFFAGYATGMLISIATLLSYKYDKPKWLWR